MILHQYEYVSPHNYTKPTVSILLDELGDYLVEYLLEGIFPLVRYRINLFQHTSQG
jgi:hypothetical protein